MAEREEREVSIHRLLQKISTAMLSIITFFAVAFYFKVDKMLDVVAGHTTAIAVIQKDDDGMHGEINFLKDENIHRTTDISEVRGSNETLQNLFGDAALPNQRKKVPRYGE